MLHVIPGLYDDRVSGHGEAGILDTAMNGCLNPWREKHAVLLVFFTTLGFETFFQTLPINLQLTTDLRLPD